MLAQRVCYSLAFAARSISCTCTEGYDFFAAKVNGGVLESPTVSCVYDTAVLYICIFKNELKFGRFLTFRLRSATVLGSSTVVQPLRHQVHFVSTVSHTKEAEPPHFNVLAVGDGGPFVAVEYQQQRREKRVRGTCHRVV